MKAHIIDKEEQDFLKIFGNLSERETIEVFEETIRDEKDDYMRWTLQMLLAEYKESCRANHGMAER